MDGGLGLELISLLNEEPALVDGLDARRRKAAERRLHVPAVTLNRGPWRPPSGPTSNGIGFYIVEGLILRRVLVRNGRSVELLAKGDCLLPWREEPSSFSKSEWSVAERSVLALLDLRHGSPLASWPTLAAQIAAKAIDRSRRLAVQSAIMSIVGVEDRLHALLWALAERWGEVGGEGIEVEVNVPQNVLAEMVGARRPTVSQALGTLAERGLLVARGHGRWLLKGAPPEKTS